MLNVPESSLVLSPVLAHMLGRRFPLRSAKLPCYPPADAVSKISFAVTAIKKLARVDWWCAETAACHVDHYCLIVYLYTPVCLCSFVVSCLIHRLGQNQPSCDSLFVQRLTQWGSGPHRGSGPHLGLLGASVIQIINKKMIMEHKRAA